MKLFLVLAATLAAAAAGTVDPVLLSKVKSGEVTQAIIDLPAVVDEVGKSLKALSLSGDAKVQALVSMLQSRTQASQAAHMSTINQLGLEAQQFWAANIVLVKGLTVSSLQELAAVAGDFLIREEFTASISPAILPAPVNISQNVQWGVEMIRAPQAWAVTQGEGVVVGIIDTGVNGGHVGLTGRFAGAWFDPYYGEANPTDVHGHGSHALCSAVGNSNGVGVAPAARWIACRGLNNQGSGGESELTTCAEQMTTANPKPHAVSNSWVGGQGQTWYNQQISAWRMADIIPVFAIGNSGSFCRTANSPGDQPNVISVGATTNTDAMATFSSRGKSTTGMLKPELSAPGNAIVSCGTGTNNYATMSGTSMATPHVSGAIALYLSANPGASFDDIYNALAASAVQPALTAADRNCGLDGEGDFPNQAYGYGRIDIGKTLGV